MDKLFLTVLNMSLTGAFVIAAVILARLPLKKAPKVISYCLWMVAGFRLVFPFSIEGAFSLIPFKAQPIPLDIAAQAVPRIDSGIPYINNAVSGVLPAAAPSASVNPLRIWTSVGAYVWLMVVAAMLLYGTVSYALLKRRTRTAIRADGNIYEADNIGSPFVLGVIKPKIYIPLSLAADERGYIILHEQTHIRRHDHIVKLAAYFILCLHWFNPFVWAAFLLMAADMEMSCDERVLKDIGGEMKKDYSRSLLSLATERRVISGSPLAFSEDGLKQRIKNVLNFKKPSRVIVAVAAALVVVLSAGLAVNRSRADEEISAEAAIEQLTNSFEYVNGEIRFQIPANYLNAENWTIDIVGSAAYEDGFSTNIRYLSLLNENEAHVWEAGKWYSVPTKNRNLTSLRMDVYLPAVNGSVIVKSVDLLAIAQAAEERYANAALEENWPVITLYGYDGNTDNGSPDEIEKHFTERLQPEDTNWTTLTDTIYIHVQIPDGTMALQTYYAEAGTDATAHIMLDNKYYLPRKYPSDDSDYTTGNIWRVADYFPDSFLGHIWAVTTDEDGVEHSSDIIPVIYLGLGHDVTGEPLPGTASLDAAVTNAIITNNRDKYGSRGDFAAEAHTTLATVEEDDTVTVYLMVLYQAYGYSDGGFFELTGSHMPVAITFDKQADSGLVMTEYWTPGDGAYYALSIKEKFPPDIYEDAIDTQKYIYAHKISCYEQAVEYGEVDTDYQIVSLIESICSSPKTASYPGAYIEEHSVEYRELVYYGRYTLDYCFNLFEQGGQRELAGHIMAMACRDIMTILGEAVEEGSFATGQDWYNAQS